MFFGCVDRTVAVKARGSRIVALLLLGLPALWLAACAQPGGTRTAAGAGGVPIAYEVAGTGDTALIFVHGWCCDRSYWREQVPAFTDAYRVVTLDLGGHGESPAGREDWSIQSFGEDVAAVARAVDADRFVLIGHSMSGRVVLEAAKRLGHRIAGIVAVDSLQDVSTPPIDIHPATESFSEAEEDFPGRMEALARGALFTETSPPELVDRIARDMAAGDPLVGIEAGIAHMTYDVAAALRQLGGPPLVLINAENPPTSEASLLAACPGSRVVLIPDAGHFVMLERPAEFNAVLRAELDRLSRPE